MKKISITIIVLLMSTLTFGQLGLGIKGAVTASNFPSDVSEIENSLNPGYQFGAFVRIGDKWHIQPEIYFTSKSGTMKYDLLTTNVEEQITLQAVDVPILIGWKIFDPPLMNIRLQAGPVASFVSQKKYNISFDGVKQDDPTDEFQNSFNDLNWGLQVGAGVDVLFLSIDLRYELGLNNIYKSTDSSVENPFSSLKNNLFFLSVGWKII